MTSSTSVPAQAPGAPRPWLTLLATAGGLFLVVMSTTVISVALPSLGTDLQADATDLQWVVDSYVLVYASLLVAGGTLGDRWGRKGAFISGVALFGVGSLIAGLAPSLPVLLVGRVVQGLGPAFLVPGSLTLIRLSFPDERRRATAIGLWSTSSGLALAVGPVLGGLIVAGIGWRWVLLMNVPLCAALAALAARHIPRPVRATTLHGFDHLGALLTTVAPAALAFSLIEGQRLGWASPTIVGAFAIGILALALFVVWERHHPEPLIDVSLFLRPAFTAANLAGLVAFFAFIGLIVYLSSYFQQVQGQTAGAAGIDVASIGLAFAIAAPISGRLTGRYGPLPPMLAGLLISGVSVLGLLRLGTATGMSAIWWNLALGGFGIGMCLTPMTTTALSAVNADQTGMASAVHNALRQFGQVLGVAVLGALVYARVPHLTTGQRLPATDRTLFVSGLHHALWTAALALLATAAITSILLTPTTRQGRRTPSQRRPTKSRSRG